MQRPLYRRRWRICWNDYTQHNKIQYVNVCGPDNIHVNVLLNVPNLSVPLTKLFQLSMNRPTGVVPQDWRHRYTKKNQERSATLPTSFVNKPDLQINGKTDI